MTNPMSKRQFSNASDDYITIERNQYPFTDDILETDDGYEAGSGPESAAVRSGDNPFWAYHRGINYIRLAEKLLEDQRQEPEHETGPGAQCWCGPITITVEADPNITAKEIAKAAVENARKHGIRLGA